MTTNGNGNGTGSADGRWGRIELKLDDLTKVVADFRLETGERLTKLETAAKLRDEQRDREAVQKVTDRQFRLMKVGLYISFLVGAASLISRFF